MKSRFLWLALAGLVVVCAVAGYFWLRPGDGLRTAEVREYPMLQPTDIPTAIAAAPDGTIWTTLDFADAIVRIRAGKLERLPKPRQNVEPMGLAVAPDQGIWFTDAPAQAIVRMAPDGTFKGHPLGTPIARLGRLAAAPDGAVWFAESTAYSFTRLQDGKLDRHVVDAVHGGPFGVAVGPDGTAWGTLQGGNRIVSIGKDGAMREYDVPTSPSAPSDIAVGPDGAIWFLEFRSNQVGRLQNDKIVEFRVPGERSALSGLAVAPDGSVWFGLLRERALGRLRDGKVQKYRLPRQDARPVSVTIDASGNVWYADLTGFVGMMPASAAGAR